MAFELDVTGTNPKATTKQALEAAVNAAISVVAGAAALGYPLKDSVSAGLSSTANGQGFAVRTTEGLSLYAKEGSSATLVSTLATGYQKKAQVDFATTANITLSGVQTIDGASRAAGTTALVKNQSSPAQNGLYTVSAGAWSRRGDMDTAGEVQGALVYVASGTVNGGRTYYTGSAVTTLGTDAIAWQADSDQSALQEAISSEADRINSLKKLEVFGVSDTPVTGPGSNSNTRVFANPISSDGRLSRLVVWAVSATVVLRVRRFSLSGGTFSRIGGDYVFRLSTGINEFSGDALLKMDVKAGEYLGIYMGSPSIATVTDTADNGGWYAVAGDQSTFAQPALSTTPRYQIKFEFESGETVSQGETIAAIDADLSVPAPLNRDGGIITRQSGGEMYDIDAARSGIAMLDRFDAPDGTPVASGAGGVTQSGDHVPSYVSPYMGDTSYIRLGTVPWAVRDGGLKTNGTGTGVITARSVASVQWPIPKDWYDQVGGFEYRARMFVPDQVSADCSLVVMAEFPEGQTAGSDPGAVLFEWNPSAKSITATRYLYTDTSASTVWTEGFTAAFVRNREVDFTIRIYKPNLLIAEIDGQKIAKFLEPADGVLPLFRSITSIGAGIRVTHADYPNVRIVSHSLREIPRAGSTRYRPKPPEPAPVVPSLVKQGLVFDGADTSIPTSPKILNFSVVPMHQYAASLGITPIDDYYAFYSTDHENGVGGIWLTTAPTPSGPWTNYAGGGADGKIYVDTVLGGQTETPLVQYDAVNNRLLMIYHNNSSPGTAGLIGQRSIVASSPDGITWTRLGIATNASDAMKSAHLGHDGYSSFCPADPLGIAPGWHGWFRHSDGSSTSRWGYSSSLDGIKWTPDLLPIDIPSIQRKILDPQIISNMGYGAVPFAYRGQRLFPIAPFRSEGVGSGGSTGYLAIVRMGDDMRNLSADEHIIPMTELTEAGVVTVSTVMVEGDTLYLYYTCDRQYVHLITADLAAPPAGVTRPF